MTAPRGVNPRPSVEPPVLRFWVLQGNDHNNPVNFGATWQNGLAVLSGATFELAVDRLLFEHPEIHDDRARLLVGGETGAQTRDYLLGLPWREMDPLSESGVVVFHAGCDG